MTSSCPRAYSRPAAAFFEELKQAPGSYFPSDVHENAQKTAEFIQEYNQSAG